MFSMDSFNPFKSRNVVNPQERQTSVLKARHEQGRAREDDIVNKLAQALMAGDVTEAKRISQSSNMDWTVIQARTQEAGEAAIRRFLKEGRPDLASSIGGFCQIEYTAARFPNEFRAGLLKTLKEGKYFKYYFPGYAPESLKKEPFQSAINEAFIRALMDKKSDVISYLMPYAALPEAQIDTENFQQLSLKAAKRLAKMQWLSTVDSLFEAGLLKGETVDDELRKAYVSALEKGNKDGHYPSIAAVADRLKLSAKQLAEIKRTALKIFKDKQGFAKNDYLPAVLSQSEVLEEYGFTDTDFADQGVQEAAVKRFFKELEREGMHGWYGTGGRDIFLQSKWVLANYRLFIETIRQDERYQKIALTILGDIISRDPNLALSEIMNKAREIPGFSEDLLRSPEMHKQVEEWLGEFLKNHSGSAIERLGHLMKLFGIKDIKASPEVIEALKTRVVNYLKKNEYFEPRTILLFPELVQFAHTPDVQKLAKVKFMTNLAKGYYYEDFQAIFGLPQDFFHSETVVRSLREGAVACLERVAKKGEPLDGLCVFFQHDPTLLVRPEIRDRIRQIVEKQLIDNDRRSLMTAVQSLGYKAEEILTPLGKQALEDRLLGLLRRETDDSYQYLETLVDDLRVCHELREIAEQAGVVAIVQETIKHLVKRGNVRLADKLGEIFQVIVTGRSTPYR